MSEWKSDEKDEKEEKRQSDPLSGATWGAIIIWAGLVFLADNIGMFPGSRGMDMPSPFPGRLSAWGLIFVGAGAILLIEAAIRLANPTFRRPIAGNIILALVFFGIGLGNLVSWNVIWPLILIAIGFSILLRGMGWRR